MRKIILALAIGAAVPVMGGATLSCSSTWWSNFQSNPIAQVQAFEQGVQVVLNDAQVAWVFVQPFLPADKAAVITQQYENAVFAVNHALQVLNDAVNAAIAAQQPNPDFSALMAAVTDAVGAVLAVIQQYMTNPPAPPPVADGGAAVAAVKGPGTVPAFADAQSGLANLVKNYHLAGVKH
jgi:hypothetical protein